MAVVGHLFIHFVKKMSLFLNFSSSSSSSRVATQVLSSAGHMLCLGHLGLPNPLKYMALGGEGKSEDVP